MMRLALLMLALAAGGISAQPLPQIKTVFVIALENHDWTQACPDCGAQQLLGNPAAPYINSLVTPGNPNAAQVSYATAYYTAARGLHPSEPNYIWSEAGTEFGVFTDNDPSTNWGNLFNTTNHLCGQLSAAGIAWKDYQEDLEYAEKASVSSAGTRPAGSNIYNGSTEYYYAAKHNPMEFFTDTQNQNVFPLAQLWTDLADNTVGRYNWITPDEFNEMHSALPNGFNYQGVKYTGNQAAVAEGDNFLSIVIPQIMASATYQDNGVIIIWVDETESNDTTNTTIPEIIISPLAKGNAYASSVVMSHSSDLKTMDEIFGLDFQTNLIPIESIDVQGTGYNYVNDSSALVNDLSDMFQVQCNGPVIAWSFTNLTLNTLSNSPVAMIDVTGTNYILASEPCSALAITQTPTTNTPLAAGTTNQVVIIVTDTSNNTACSTNWIAVFNATPPVIMSQPASMTNNAGTVASFGVVATADMPLSFQWYFGTNVLPGQTNSTLTLPAVGMANAGLYFVVITNVAGSMSSAPAMLSVLYQTPCLVGERMMPGAGGFQLTFCGPAAQNYRVLASDELAQPVSAWTVLGSGAFGSANIIFTDIDAMNHTGRFYTIESSSIDSP
jgi:hypothetical protein